MLRGGAQGAAGGHVGAGGATGEGARGTPVGEEDGVKALVQFAARANGGRESTVRDLDDLERDLAPVQGV
jgi:hypothetical protein